MFVKLLVAALALLAVGCSSRHSTTATGQNPSPPTATLASAQSGAWRTYSYPGVLTFDYPRDWHVARFDGVGSSAAAALVAISNARIGTASSTPSTSPAAVSAVWYDVGNDGVPFHPNTTIDGRRAQITTATPASGCPKGGPQARSISAMVVRDPSNFIELWACLPRTEMSANTAAVLAITRSLHVTAE